MNLKALLIESFCHVLLNKISSASINKILFVICFNFFSDKPLSENIDQQQSSSLILLNSKFGLYPFKDNETKKSSDFESPKINIFFLYYLI